LEERPLRQLSKFLTTEVGKRFVFEIINKILRSQTLGLKP